MTFDITVIIEAIIALIAAIVTSVVIPYIKSRTTSEEQASLIKWVSLAVAAAEQIYISGEGAKKKAYVVEYLKEKGITVNAADLDVLIESAVGSLKGGEGA